MNDAPVWSPTPERIAASNLARFLEFVRSETSDPPGGLDELHAWSVRHPDRFWRCVWEFCEVVHETPPVRIVDDPTRMPGARWFEGARLNFARNLLRFDDDREAVVVRTEIGRAGSVTYRELRGLARRFACALRQRGIGPGDRVVGFLPNGVEAVVAMLGATAVGAVWSCCSPEFGTEAALDRLGQLDPKVLVGGTRYRWAGKVVDVSNRLEAIAARIPTLEAVVVTDELGPGAVRAISWDAFLGWPGSEPSVPGDAWFASLPFDHPVYTLFSSGTTGLPKCIVHGGGGTLLQHLKELVLHTDLTRDDRILYYTTTGWMMWNWLVSALAVGATVVLYDGSPFHPRDAAMWDVVDEERVTVFGTSARYLTLAEKRGLHPVRTHDLKSLRTMLSTGSPLHPASFDWVYSGVKRDLHLASISGGTDIVSCFTLGDPTRPVWRGELQGPGLGMAVEVLSPSGEPLGPGTPGELACLAAFPSMPIGFLDDPDGRRYRAAYFERFPGVWHHGDWAERTGHGGFVIHGRSDATLNPGGVRIGTAEIYRPVERFDEVVEALAVAVVGDGGTEAIALFLVLRPGVVLDDDLRERVRGALRESASPRHVPSRITQVPDLPRTVSGKVSEVAVRNALRGLPVDNEGALANAEVLAHFRL